MSPVGALVPRRAHVQTNVEAVVVEGIPTGAIGPEATIGKEGHYRVWSFGVCQMLQDRVDGGCRCEYASGASMKLEKDKQWQTF